MRNLKHVAAIVVCLTAAVVANPVRRSPDLEARRRSAIDRSMIRFGRSYPPEPSAADLREAFQRPTRRGNSFLRFGKSEPLTFTTEDLINLLRSYENGYEDEKRSPHFIRLGRDPKFIRLGRSGDDVKPNIEEGTQLYVSGNPQRKNRARDHFIRLGRDNEEISEVDKRSVDCHDCEP